PITRPTRQDDLRPLNNHTVSDRHYPRGCLLFVTESALDISVVAERTRSAARLAPHDVARCPVERLQLVLTDRKYEAVVYCRTASKYATSPTPQVFSRLEIDGAKAALREMTASEVDGTVQDAVQQSAPALSTRDVIGARRSGQSQHVDPSTCGDINFRP